MTTPTSLTPETLAELRLLLDEALENLRKGFTLTHRAAEVLSLPPVRWHTNPRTCPHANEHACPTCDHDNYYATTYPDCP